MMSKMINNMSFKFITNIETFINLMHGSAGVRGLITEYQWNALQN